MIEKIDINKLKEAEYNPRVQLVPGMADYDKLKRSIETFGNVEPVVWNKRTGNVVGGHQRLTVLRDMGETEIPCEVVDLDEEDEKTLNLALNKIKGEWDYDKLEEMLNGFDAEMATLSGFSADEIAVLLSGNEDGIDENDIDWDEEDNLIGSYVVTLQFANAQDAQLWCNKEGFPGKIKEGSSTTVIRMD